MKLAKVVTGLAAAIALSSGSAYADNLRWKMPVAFATNLPGLGSPAAWVAENLTTASDGSIQVRVYEPGELVPPFDILQSVSDGKVPTGYTWIGYDQGKVPAVPLFAAVPFGMKPWAYIGWYYYGGGHDMLQDVYANKGFNVHAQLCGIIGPETAGWYADKIESLEDYDGMKIRFAGLGGKVLEELGASVTMMPGGELYQALEKGTIDATEFSMPAIDQILGFQQVVKYNLFPGWHQQFTAQYLLINGDEWEKTTAAQKALVEASCTAATTRGLAEGEYLNGAVLAGFQEEGVQADQIPREVLEQLKAVTERVLESEAENDDDFARVYRSQQEFMETYQVWDSRAYLPSDL
ncbi:TRAP transporter substrate-binding protein [Marinobacter mobilis]|uniref:TRAP-type mannitol/chloroaromatic compound transport system, substrate-binding protein n=1 Tax=Marinobacter mobilis TaxID=488533 RepID=A0A1H3CHZ2_9GAMM|nr:TRAP transporter substrate-binding protein [Marinobacter mobilis]SDW76612.1 TRAP-type mannitol/chloroaromatic compound transport system, substrate-binding protein [Marinobacter mobilis]SDX53630.1 TRAP-type mannitol/chloroaromatic compound transport system, substrate-binding protein [Marinobacter mobilis]